MRYSLITALGALLVMPALVGCQTSRADYRDDVAHSVCQEMQQCESFGANGAQFADYDDCVTELKSTYNRLWPAEQCSDGRIDQAKFDQCKRRAVAQTCDENILDAISFRFECSAADVCVAPPDE